ncbi:PilZ domain-containing protein [Endozoicomonas sp. SM1973]|uniref:Cyclic diguanosine monophosphate-binding protein n=1 Tax=Spartinivicinus marinus TaxID=2994442 RepID=A0A853I1P6_9GAMM|nr:PilZ domain-containing protein [Spartinivicinus marinus]MCX4025990.1 PilZ domain-containing protein [Spartinivicinus marinus]NYZ67890.1 PilZ domain-containing protein [Spartinivicinus marinus]
MAKDSSGDQERRKFSRIAFDAGTVLTQNEQDWKVSLVDISLKGILVKAPKDFDINPDKPLLAKIQLDNVLNITMALRFAHKEGDHIGFTCTQIDIDSISHLRRLTELNLGSTDLLERELCALGCD